VNQLINEVQAVLIIHVRDEGLDTGAFCGRVEGILETRGRE
jgi:hypothetical protein